MENFETDDLRIALRFLAFLALLSACLGIETASARASCISKTPSYTVAVPGRPFSVRELPDQTTALVSINPGTPSQVAGIAILTCKAGEFVYDRTIPLSPQPTGLALTPDGKLLVVADDSYIAFLHTDELLARGTASIAFVKAERGDIEDDDAGATYVSISPDGRYAFVSEEQAGTITVLDLSKVPEAGAASDVIVGDIDVGNAPVATVVPQDGRKLYGTVEVARKALGYSPVCKMEGAADDPARLRPGAVFSLDLKTAEQGSRAGVSFAAAQCGAVRIAITPGEREAWVTNRASGSISLFDLTAADGRESLTRAADVPVGSNPVPIAATRDGRLLLVGITNRFGAGGTKDGHIVVLDARTRQALGTIATGSFPREFSYGPSPTLFLSNNRSATITVYNENLIDALIVRTNRLGP